MNRFGLIGDPIATSLSPALFEAAYSGEFSYDLIQGADFGSSWKAFEDRYKGINVTAPFKQQAFSQANIFTAGCRKIGAGSCHGRFKSEVPSYLDDIICVYCRITSVSFCDWSR